LEMRNLKRKKVGVNYTRMRKNKTSFPKKGGQSKVI